MQLVEQDRIARALAFLGFLLLCTGPLYIKSSSAGRTSSLIYVSSRILSKSNQPPKVYRVDGMRVRLQELQEEDDQAQRIKVEKLGKNDWDNVGYIINKCPTLRDRQD